MESSERSSGNSEHALPRVLTSASRFLLLLGGYFLLQIVLRLITSNTTDLDESEQLLATQQWQWGYGPQPPLYTWLLIPFVKTLGPGALALALLKDALLFGTYALTFASARLMFRDAARSALAALSLLFLPQIAWEAQRDLSHSVLVTFVAVATFFVVLRLKERLELNSVKTRENRRRPTWPLYLALGLCIGGGVLSKYSFLVFVGGLLIAGIAISSFRPILLNPGIVISATVCAIIVSPHLIWARQHADWVTSTSSKLKIATDQPWLKTCAVGLKNLFTGAGSHLGPLLAFYCVVCWKRLPKSSIGMQNSEGAQSVIHTLTPSLPSEAGGEGRGEEKLSSKTPLPALRRRERESKSVSLERFAHSDASRFIRAGLIGMFAILVIGIFAFHITGFKDRWFMPLCIWVPLLLVAMFSARLNSTRIRRLIGIAAVIALVIAILIPTRVWLAKTFRFPQVLNVPFDKLTLPMRNQLPSDAIIIAGDNWVGGNMKRCFPSNFVTSPNIFLDFHPTGTEAWLVWNASKNEALPPKLRRFADELGIVDTNEFRYVSAPMKFWPERTSRLGLLHCTLRKSE